MVWEGLHRFVQGSPFSIGREVVHSFPGGRKDYVEMTEDANDQVPVSLSDVAYVPVTDLRLDNRNPRLFLQDNLPDEEIIQILWRSYAVDEVALSIANSGYFYHEPLLVAIEDGCLTVLDGNRRLVAVRLLLDDALRMRIRATGLPQITQARKEELAKLPVAMCQRDTSWRYTAYKHFNGPQPWQSYARAQYIAWVHDELKVPLEDIAQAIGDRHWTVHRLYRGLMVLRQAESSGVFILNDRWSVNFNFLHLHIGLDNENIRKFIGIDDQTSYRPDPVPEAYVKHLGELMLWLYGQKSTNIEPKVKYHNPDLRNLGSVIGSRAGLAALRRDLSLEAALDISKGDDLLFKGHLLEARWLLQKAYSRQPTGDSGGPGNLRTANEIRDLAERLVSEMDQYRLRYSDN